MARQEFRQKIRDAAWERAAFKCEAVGADYGLDAGKRCNGDLTAGAEFDHIIADSIGGDASLENCAVVCKVCHAFKTVTVDTPRAAKTKRQARLHRGAKHLSTFRKPRPGDVYDWHRQRYVRGDV